MVFSTCTKSRLWRLGIFAMVLAAPPAPAQVIEDIVVTARKREESLQEVPISIGVLSSDQLQDRGIEDAYDVALFTPNFTTTQTVGRTLDRPVIRGMANPSTGGEPNASYFIDGVFVASSVSTATTSTVDRVEVLRGPQSAQFGRATFSGAVNYVTRQPTGAWTGEINVQAGSDEDQRLGGWVSGPILADKLAMLVSANYDTWAGQWRNQLAPNTSFTSPAFPPALERVPTRGDNSELGGEETTDLLLKLAWTPTDSTQLNFKYGYTKGDDDHWPTLVPDVPAGEYPANCYLPEDENGNPTQYFQTGTDTLGNPQGSGGAFCGTFDPTGWVNRINIPDFEDGVLGRSLSVSLPEVQRFAHPDKPGTRRETNRFLLDLTQSFGQWDMTARAAYNRDRYQQVFDLDHTENRAIWGLFHFNQRAYQDDQQYELRFSGPIGERIQTTVGAYYFEAERESAIRSYTGPAVGFGGFDPCTGGATPITTEYPCPTVTEVENIAVFGSIDVQLGDTWTAAFEIRWADDTKNILGGNQTSDEQSTAEVTPRLTLRYTPSDELMFYVLAAKGNKPAAFNVECFRADLLPEALGECQSKKNLQRVKEETQWTYEIGTKTSWFDRRLTANWSGFFIDWENQALFTVDCITLTVAGTPNCATFQTNAGKSEVYGFELETNLVVNDHLFLIANWGFQDGEFKEGTDALLGKTTGNGDLKGKTIPNASKHSLVLGATVTNQISQSLESFLRADFIYESDRFGQQANFNKLAERKLMNLRLGVESDTWTLSGYVNNMLDDDTPYAILNIVNFAKEWSNGANGELFSLNPARGRHFGVELQYRFGAL